MTNQHPTRAMRQLASQSEEWHPTKMQWVVIWMIGSLLSLLLLGALITIDGLLRAGL